MALRFQWDKYKAEVNIKKHGVSFDEACTVSDDPLVYIFDDEVHSVDEDREITIDHSILNRLLLVFFSERAKDQIHIFSARKATKKERRDFEEHANP